MARASIIVFSETGFTRAYARWISEETGIEAVELGETRLDGNWGAGDLVVIGSPVHGGELAQAKRIRRVIDSSAGAHVICFATGISDSGEGVISRLRSASCLADDVSLHYFTGGFAKDRLTPASRTMITLYRIMMKHQRYAAEHANLLLERTGHDGDYTDRSLIDPLVSEVRDFLGRT